MEKISPTKPKKSIRDILFLIVIVLIVIGLGLFALNQVLTFYYKSEFLQTPCALCEELNPHLKDCFRIESNIENKNIINITLEEITLFPRS